MRSTPEAPDRDRSAFSADVTVGPPLSPGRRTVLLAVRRLEPATVDVVAVDLAMSGSGARQHLRELARAGLIEPEPVPRGPGDRGRPRLRYATTPEGEAVLPKRYRDLSRELLGYLDDTDPGLVDRLFAKRRDARAAGARDRLARATGPAEQVEELARILDDDGYLTSVVEVGPGRFRIDEHNCAISAVAARWGQACSSEIHFIREVLPGFSVERIRHMKAGDRSCAYDIRVGEDADRT